SRQSHLPCQISLRSAPRTSHLGGALRSGCKLGARSPVSHSAQIPASLATSPVRSRSRLRLGIFYGFILPVLFLALLAGVGIGSTSISWPIILRVVEIKLLPHAWTSAIPISKADQLIVWLIRVPRVVVAFFVGAALASAGVIMQALFRNPLAEP